MRKNVFFYFKLQRYNFFLRLQNQHIISNQTEDSFILIFSYVPFLLFTLLFFYFLFLITAWSLIQLLTTISGYSSCATIPWVAQVRAANSCPIKMFLFFYVASPLILYHIPYYSYEKFHLTSGIPVILYLWAVQALLMLLSSL